MGIKASYLGSSECDLLGLLLANNWAIYQGSKHIYCGYYRIPRILL